MARAVSCLHSDRQPTRITHQKSPVHSKCVRGSATDPGARLDFHERGFGPFTARLKTAATNQFDAVAATALDPVQASNNAVAAVPGAAGASSGDDSGDESDSDDDD